MEPYDDDLLPLVICGFVIAFILAFGIGANDVANSFGTSVGAKVLTLTQACILGSIFEILGSVLLGYKVSDTIRKGIVDVSLYANGGEKQLAAGCVSALTACAAWLILATRLGLPVSGTHSVVGATIGFTLVVKGTKGINWTTLIAIVASWFVSPITSGTVSTLIYCLVRKLILKAPDPLNSGFRALPFFYGATVAINFLSVFLDGPKLLKLDGLPLWTSLSVSAALAILVGAFVWVVVVPYYRRQLKQHQPEFTLGMSNETTPAVTPTSPTRSQKQLTSQNSEDSRALGVIPESGEMVTQSDVDNDSSGVREMNAKNRALLATMDDCSILSRSLSPPDKSRLQLLDTNPQIDTLKFIDETISCCKSLDSSYLAGMGESYDMKNGSLADSSDTITQLERFAATKDATVVDFDSPIFLCDNMDANANGVKENVGKNGKPGSKVERGVTPNSSAAPLLRAVSPPANKEFKSSPPPEALKLFSFLQVLTAVFGSFAHGGNDVSNAIGPLVALWLLYTQGSAHEKAETPLAILFYGGLGIAVGLWLWGRRVIKTLGEDLTQITPDTGFTIELGAAMTVLLASKIGLPVSTTHCKVGSIVFVGYASKKPVHWNLFRNIIIVWFITVPSVALLGAFLMAGLNAFAV